MTGDVDLARGVDGIERNGVSAIEAQHTHPLERNRFAQQHRDTRKRHVERRRFGHQARQRGEERMCHVLRASIMPRPRMPVLAPALPGVTGNYVRPRTHRQTSTSSSGSRVLRTCSLLSKTCTWPPIGCRRSLTEPGSDDEKARRMGNLAKEEGSVKGK